MLPEESQAKPFLLSRRYIYNRGQNEECRWYDYQYNRLGISGWLTIHDFRLEYRFDKHWAWFNARRCIQGNKLNKKAIK